MKINTRTVDDITVIDISGSLDTQTSGAASDEMARIADSTSKMLLNLESLEFLSSAGLRVILRTAKQLSGTGGTLKICNAVGVVKEVMEISGFGTLLELFDSDADALASF